VLLALALVRGLLYAVLNQPFGSPDDRGTGQLGALLLGFVSEAGSNQLPADFGTLSSRSRTASLSEDNLF